MTEDIILTGLALSSDINQNGVQYSKECLANITKQMDHMKIRGDLIDWEHDENGIMIIKKFNIKSVDLVK